MISDTQELLQAAIDARQHAYARYSRFSVGAAIRDESGRIHIGCNVENASFPLGACAEGNAIGAMIAAGGQSIAAVAIVGGRDTPVRCLPCGGCRQRLAEFADADTRVIVLDPPGDAQQYLLSDLLPQSFSLLPAGDDQP